MTVFDARRLPASVFKLDVERMRRGLVLGQVLHQHRRAPWPSWPRAAIASAAPRPDLSDLDVDLRNVDVGLDRGRDAVVPAAPAVLRWWWAWTRRWPCSRECTGYFDDAGRFVNTFDSMEVWAVHDGSEAPYDGDLLQRDAR